MILTSESVDKIVNYDYSHFSVVLFMMMYKVVLTSGSVDKTLNYDYLNI